ncbi:MAG TPA: MBL fold metallo-hydrolase [Thermoanaerobaculia bacterium]|nr:MBL fold metallo-hydrolase [Thermoanaerobaculia bacterium]
MRRLFPLALLLASSAFGQPNWENVEIKAEKVAGTVYMLTGLGGNIGVSAGEDGIVIVDDQYAPLAPKIREALRAIMDKPLKFIINTHYHGDHTGGNAALGREAPILAHHNTRKRLAAGTRRGTSSVPPAAKEVLPIVTFDSSLSIHVNGEEIRAVHFPSGHTDGDVVIFFTSANVVHMGDDFFNGRFPLIDWENGGSVTGLIANIDKILGMIPDDVKIIPGHGPLAEKAALQRYLTMLRETSAVIAAAKKAGKTVEQAREEKVLARWEEWGKQSITTDRFIEILYNAR